MTKDQIQALMQALQAQQQQQQPTWWTQLLAALNPPQKELWQQYTANGPQFSTQRNAPQQPIQNALATIGIRG